MNQAAEECDVIPPSSASLIGHRLSLSDLFCTESFSLTKSPSSSINFINYPSDAVIVSHSQFYNNQPFHQLALTTSAQQQLSGGYQFQVTPCGHFISPTNPFFADLFSEDSHHQLSQPYLHDQFQWKHSLQPKYRVMDYLTFSTTITSTMRSELIIWLGKVNKQFGYDIETFLLAVNFVDRFLAATVLLPVDSLQLVGLAAILVAAKKEEPSPPEIEELVGLSGNSYSAKLIREMEICLLKKLDFHLCAPTANYFLEYYMTFTKEKNVSTDIRGVRDVFYQLLENSLIHYELINYSPSTVAAAALCLAQRFLPTLLPIEPLYWLVEIFSGSTELDDIQRCLVEMSLYHSGPNQSGCWPTVPALTQVSSISMSSTAPGNNILGDILFNQFSAVDFCNQFANFSIAPQ